MKNQWAIKGLLAVLLVLLLALTACGDASSHSQTDAFWYGNCFRSAGTPPFSLPAGGTAEDDGFYSYGVLSGEAYDAVVTDLCAQGFASVKMENGCFLLRSDCMIFLNRPAETETLSLSWYATDRAAAKGGITADHAANILMPNRETSLSPIALYPIDITPDGFFARTGGQLFAVPSYSYDGFRESGYDGLIMASNERYSCMVYYVKGNLALSTDMERVATCDMDGDGREDVLLLSYGPTSGLFTFSVTIVTASGTYRTMFNISPCDLRFANREGTLVLEAVNQDTVQHTLTIALEERESGKTVTLYENGVPISTWNLLFTEGTAAPTGKNA